MVFINNLDIHSLLITSFLTRISKLFRNLISSLTIMAKNVAKSPIEMSAMVSSDHKLAMAKQCSHEGVVAGAKAAVVATIATAIPTMASARMLPWAKANLNHTAQALIISTVAGAAYFIVADKTILAAARRNSFNQHAGFEPNNNTN